LASRIAVLDICCLPFKRVNC